MELIVVGAGSAGCAMTHLFLEAGISVRAMLTATKEGAEHVSRIFPDTPVFQAGQADLSVLCVEPALLVFSTKDDQLSSAIAQFSGHRESWKGFSAIHLSGGMSVELLNCFQEKGARVGALHPCYPIPTRESRFPDDGTVCMSFEGDAELGESFRGVLERAGIQFASLSGISRAAYHAAMVLSAGHVMTLLARAEQVFVAEGLSREDARKMLSSVAQGVVRNFREAPELVDSASLLTGPFVRGDEALIETQREVLDNRVSGLGELYLRVGQETKRLLED